MASSSSFTEQPISTLLEPSTPWRPVTLPSTDLETITSIQSSLTLPHFTHTDAFTLGLLLRSRLLSAPKPTIITILSSNTHQLLFSTITRPGPSPDNDIWVQRKTRTVLRFGVSSFFMGAKFGMDEKAFAEKYGLSPEERSGYAIHGGAVPVWVEGVETGPVAVVVVSGLKQEEDHGVVVEVLGNFAESLRAARK